MQWMLLIGYQPSSEIRTHFIWIGLLIPCLGLFNTIPYRVDETARKLADSTGQRIQIIGHSAGGLLLHFYEIYRSASILWNSGWLARTWMGAQVYNGRK